MPRGDGKHAKQATAQGKLSGYIKPKDASWDSGASPMWVDWGEIPDQLIVGVVKAVNREDGAVLFGHNRAQTAYAVTIFFGGNSTPYYFPCNESGLVELYAFLQGLIEATA